MGLFAWLAERRRQKKDRAQQAFLRGMEIEARRAARPRPVPSVRIPDPAPAKPVMTPAPPRRRAVLVADDDDSTLLAGMLIQSQGVQGLTIPDMTPEPYRPHSPPDPAPSHHTDTHVSHSSPSYDSSPASDSGGGGGGGGGGD